MLLLRQAENYQETVANPCWPTGYRKSLSLSSIYDSPCTEKERPGLPLNTTVVVSGTGNGNLCAVHVSKLFDFTNCSFSRCSFDGVFQPEVSGNFIVSPSAEQGGGGPGVTWQQNPTAALQGWLLVPTTLVTAALYSAGLLPACPTAASIPPLGLLCLLLHGGLHPDSDGETRALAQ